MSSPEDENISGKSSGITRYSKHHYIDGSDRIPVRSVGVDKNRKWKMKETNGEDTDCKTGFERNTFIADRLCISL
jgi:hypothetical protein